MNEYKWYLNSMTLWMRLLIISTMNISNNVCYSAIGCEDLSPPTGAWMNRSHGDIAMGCQATGQVWHLRCVNGKWLGEMHTCLTSKKYSFA